jgi:acetyl esterase/lipase
VQRVRDIAYYEGPRADPVKHRLDLYLPKERPNFPVVFFIHGGAWTHGDKEFFGIYSALGKSLARHGIGAVIPSYRLSPAVSHPEHIRDIARAFAWTYHHVARYGGRPDALFVSGHSAGGHLAALLATDDSYLNALGLTLTAIKGVIPMSGIYDIPSSGLFFDLVFGTDAKLRQSASPLAHVRADTPPFLIIYADEDLRLCGKDPSEAFCRALRDKKADARTLEVKHRNHMTLLLNVCVEKDPVASALLQFIADHVHD